MKATFFILFTFLSLNIHANGKVFDPGNMLPEITNYLAPLPFDSSYNNGDLIEMESKYCYENTCEIESNYREVETIDSEGVAIRESDGDVTYISKDKYITSNGNPIIVELASASNLIRSKLALSLNIQAQDEISSEITILNYLILRNGQIKVTMRYTLCSEELCIKPFNFYIELAQKRPYLAMVKKIKFKTTFANFSSVMTKFIRK